MFLFRKNIILVPSDYDGVSVQKGIISLDCFNGMSKCILKCYNLDISKKLVLGLNIDGRLLKFDVDLEKTKTFEFVVKDNITSASEISAVLLDIGEYDYRIILWGSTQINMAWQSTLKMMLDDEISISTQSIQKKEIQNNEQPNQDTKFCDENIEKFIDSVMQLTEEENQSKDIESNDLEFDEKLDRFDYRENLQNKFYDEVVSGESLKTDDENNNSLNNENQKRENTFFDRLSNQIEKMFDTNQSFEILNEIFPNSKFCKVNFDDGTGYYVFGIIYDNGVPKYLCYGMPAQKNDAPPKDFSELYQWLPIDVNNEDGDGFYMMYQDAETGKNISIDII